MIELGNHISSLSATAIEQPSGSTATELQPSGTLSPDPTSRMALSDDGIYEIAALLAEAAMADRKGARQMRDASEKLAEEQTNARIQSMRDRAAAVRTAAMVNGLTGMAAGGCQIAGGLGSMREASKIETGTKQPTLTVNEETGACALSGGGESAEAAGARASAYSSLGSGASGMLTGSGALVAGAYQYEADLLDADAAAHEAKAGRAERAADEHADAMADAKQLMNKVMEFLKDVRGSQNAAAQAAIIRG